MTERDIYNAVGDVSEELIAESAPGKTKKPKKNNMLKWLSTAACLALVLAVTIPLALSNRAEKPADITSAQSGSPHPPEYYLEIIDSLDKVNYYAAMNLISGSAVYSDVISPLKIAVGASSDSADEPSTGAWDEEIDETSRIGVEDMWGETFTVTCAVYFKVSVTDPDSFLGQKVGVGTVDVVMTDLRIGINPFAMITFRNSDRFYSCVKEMNALTDGKNEFFTRLYVSGFSLFKDLTEIPTWFTVDYDENEKTVRSINWREYRRDTTKYDIVDIPLTADKTRVKEAEYSIIPDYLYGRLSYYLNPASDVSSEDISAVKVGAKVLQAIELLGKPNKCEQLSEGELNLIWYTSDGKYAVIKVCKPDSLSYLEENVDVTMKFGIVRSVEITDIPDAPDTDYTESATDKANTNEIPFDGTEAVN